MPIGFLKVDDATPYRHMYYTRFDQPVNINETVLAAKTFLDAELAKADDIDHVNKSINMLFDTNSQFSNCKKSGVGQTVILKFLGGSWRSMIRGRNLGLINLLDLLFLLSLNFVVLKEKA